MHLPTLFALNGTLVLDDCVMVIFSFALFFVLDAAG